MTPTDIRQATHVKVDGQIYPIKSKWGIDPNGFLLPPSKGGFGVYTEDGKRVAMYEAEAYYK